MYAILDIETIGGSPKVEKITEIAVYFHNGEKIVDEWSTLINPGHKSYSLGKLCKALGIEINGRHRAAGDAFILKSDSATGPLGFFAHLCEIAVTQRFAKFTLRILLNFPFLADPVRWSDLKYFQDQ